MKSHWSIRARLYFLELVVAAPLIGLLAYSIYRNADSATQQAKVQALGLAQVFAGLVRNSLEETQELLVRLAERPRINGMVPQECAPVLKVALNQYPEVSSLVVVNLHRDLVCSALRHGDSVDARDVDWYRGMLQEEKFVADSPHFDPASARWGLRLAYPIHDSQDGLIGVVGLSIDLAHYGLPTGSTPMPPGTEYGIFDDKGVFIAHYPDPKKWVGKNVRETKWANIALDKSEGYTEAIGRDGVDRVYGYTTVRGSKWKAIANIPADVVFAPVRQLMIEDTLSALPIALAVALIAWAMSRGITRPIREIAKVANAVKEGRQEARVTVQGPREINEVANQLNQMLDASQRADLLLRAAMEQLHCLSQRLLDVQESERRHIARELHDEIGQGLTSMKLRLQTVQRSPSDANVALHLETCIQIASRTLEQVRELGHELHPVLLDDFGLIAALRAHVEQQTSAIGLIGHFSAAALPARLDARLEIACFRVVQEALTNVLRHSKAIHVWVEISRNGHELEVRIRDDGIGYDPATGSSTRGRASLGLVSMQERTKLAGGRIEFKSAPMLGTEVCAIFPLTFATTGMAKEVRA